MYQILHNDRPCSGLKTAAEAPQWVPATYLLLDTLVQEQGLSRPLDVACVDHYQVTSVTEPGAPSQTYVDPAYVALHNQTSKPLQAALFHNRRLISIGPSLTELLRVVPKQYVSPHWYQQMEGLSELPDDLTETDHYRVVVFNPATRSKKGATCTYYWVNAYQQHTQGPRWSLQFSEVSGQRLLHVVHHYPPQFSAQVHPYMAYMKYPPAQWQHFLATQREQGRLISSDDSEYADHLVLTDGDPQQVTPALLAHALHYVFLDSQWDAQWVDDEIPPESLEYQVFHRDRHVESELMGWNALQQRIPFGYLDASHPAFAALAQPPTPATHDYYEVRFSHDYDTDHSMGYFYHLPTLTGQPSTDVQAVRRYALEHPADGVTIFPTFGEAHSVLPYGAVSVLDSPLGQTLGLRPHDTLPGQAPHGTIHAFVGDDLNASPDRWTYHYYVPDS